jgi:UPF0716 family protein affecting phage T7 exclusion
VEFTVYWKQTLLLAAAAVAWAKSVMKFRPMGMVTAVLGYLILIPQAERQHILAVEAAVVIQLGQIQQRQQQDQTVVQMDQKQEHQQMHLLIVAEAEAEADVMPEFLSHLQVVMVVQEG